MILGVGPQDGSRSVSQDFEAVVKILSWRERLCAEAGRRIVDFYERQRFWRTIRDRCFDEGGVAAREGEGGCQRKEV